jgi:hypothetical protein
LEVGLDQAGGRYQASGAAKLDGGEVDPDNLQPVVS